MNLQKATRACSSPVQKAQISLWSFLVWLWRQEVGRSCSVWWEGCSGRSYPILFLPEWECFPLISYISTRGLEKQSLCNVQWPTHRNLISSLFSIVVQTLLIKIFFKMSCLKYFLASSLQMSTRNLCCICPRWHWRQNFCDMKQRLWHVVKIKGISVLHSHGPETRLQLSYFRYSFHSCPSVQPSIAQSMPSNAFNLSAYLLIFIII